MSEIENVFTISFNDIKSVMNSDKKEFIVSKNKYEKLKVSSTLLSDNTDIMIWEENQYELMISCSRQDGCGAEIMNLNFSSEDNHYIFDLKYFNIGTYKFFYSVKNNEMIVFDLCVK